MINGRNTGKRNLVSKATLLFRSRQLNYHEASTFERYKTILSYPSWTSREMPKKYSEYILIEFQESFPDEKACRNTLYSNDGLVVLYAPSVDMTKHGIFRGENCSTVRIVVFRRVLQQEQFFKVHRRLW